MSVYISKYAVSPNVLEFASQQKLTRRDLDVMLDRSARVSHQEWNLRYKEWYFQVENNTLIKMGNLSIGVFSGKINSPLPELKPNEFLGYEDCSKCNGVGCSHCNNSGEEIVVRKITQSRIGVMT